MNLFKTTAILAAAGSSSRMGGINKQLIELCGKPVIAHTIEAFEKAVLIDDIIIVTKEESIKEIKEICARFGFKKVRKIIRGGKERYDSVMCGIAEADNADYIAVHDGARALITPKQIDMLCEAAFKQGAVVPCRVVTDTVKRIKNGKIAENIEREGLYTVQTPQIFKAGILKDAYDKFTDENVTDDSSVVAKAGYDVYIAEMPSTNIKITAPDDLDKAKRILGF